MKKYKVTVNGTAYEIELEDITGTESAKTAVASAPKAEPAPAAPVSSGEGETVSSPMPGNILSVNVKVGDAVKKGDVLLILEAMKMENEIVAPCDGTVKSVVASGISVETGAVLCEIE